MSIIKFDSSSTSHLGLFWNSSFGGIATLKMYYSSRGTRSFHSQGVWSLVSGSFWSRSVSGLRSKSKHPTNLPQELPQGFFRFDVYKHLGRRRVPSSRETLWERILVSQRKSGKIGEKVFFPDDFSWCL